jgi:hypothetical protein
MNYSELTQAIQDFAEYDEATFVANIPVFIRQAEEDIYRTISVPDLRKVHTTATVASTSTYTKPTDFLAVVSFGLVNGSGETVFLDQKDKSFVREAYPSAATEGFPVYYANSDDTTFLFGPTPDDAYTAELTYQYDPASIIDSSTSWLGDNAENALLFGSLVKGDIFMKGEEAVSAMYSREYEKAMNALGSLVEVKAKTDQFRSGERR